MSFQHLKDYILDKFPLAIAYLDDILVFFVIEKHCPHTHTILESLLRYKLLAAVETCEWHTQHIAYLGHILEPGIMRIGPERIKAVQD